MQRALCWVCGISSIRRGRCSGCISQVIDTDCRALSQCRVGCAPPMLLLGQYYMTVQAVLFPLVGRSGTELPPSVVRATPHASATCRCVLQVAGAVVGLFVAACCSVTCSVLSLANQHKLRATGTLGCAASAGKSSSECAVWL